MRTKDEIKILQDEFQSKEEIQVEFHEKAIYKAYHRDEQHQTLAIKILSIVGGFLASLAFLGFLSFFGIFNSELTLVAYGFIFIAASLWVHININQILLDTVSISSYLIGFVLVGMGFAGFDLNESIICLIFITIALFTLSIVQTYLLSFISILIITGSIFALILMNHVEDLIHLFVGILAFLMTYLFLKEAKFITTKTIFSKLYNSLKAALIVSFLAGLFCLGKKGILPLTSEFSWLSSVLIIGIILYLISDLFPLFKITNKNHQIGIYILTTIILIPTAFSPAISGSILLLLLSFKVNYKTGFGLGIIAFLYFLGQFYYDLHFNLLTKSILLFSTGILFIALYLFTYKKLTTHEKV
jgi:hypothetical protein